MYGDFVLASGERSDYYVDIKKASTDPTVLSLIAEHMARRIGEEGIEVDRIAGVVLGSVPLAVALSLRMGVPFIMIRKERKAHGTGKQIEGSLLQGDRVIVVEDVITSAGSAAFAVETIRRAGGIVDEVAAVIDRQAGGEGRLANLDIRLVSLLKAEDLLE
jgi:orotate phosphoribosyltransferase